MQNVRYEQLMLQILQAKILEIRDIDAGEKPFLYTSNNFGPGYISIKNLVGRKEIIKSLCRELAKKIIQQNVKSDFIAGNVTGGVIPGWLISEYLNPFLKKEVPFVYIRDSKKQSGKHELITGLSNNPEIQPGSNCLIVEELTNFAQTICTSAQLLRNSGYKVTNAACILFYNNSEGIKALEKAKIQIIYLFTLPELLEVAKRHNTHSQKLIQEYEEFLKDPIIWQRKYHFI